MDERAWLLKGRVVADGTGLALALSWLVVVLFCPVQVAVAFPAGCPTLFVGAFMVGCVCACAVRLAVRDGRRVLRGQVAAALLPLGMGIEMLALAQGFPQAALWVVLDSWAAGVGEGIVLLAWGRRLSGGSSARTLGVLAVACIAMAGIAALFGALGSTVASMRVLLVVLALATPLGLVWASRAGRAGRVEGACQAGGACQAEGACRTGGTTQIAGTPSSSAAPSRAAAPATLRETFAHLWEPILGLGLSFMSSLLPWGSFLAQESVTIPAFWSFAIGVLLVGVAGLCAPPLARGRVDTDLLTHVAVPVLAAAVVGLRLAGDLSSTNAALFAIRGIGSGVASAGFVVCAWLAMGREARQAQSRSPAFALGLGVACLVGFVILPLHALDTNAASLVAPFSSLAFLVAASCGSIAHLRRRSDPVATQAHPAAGSPCSIEEASDVLARRFGLSPRETEVLRQLALGRSAERIGGLLGISPNTVRSHVGSIHGKLGIQSRDQLADLIEEVRHG